MQTKDTIKIVINPDGSITSLVEGVSGPSCSKLVEWLKKLGTVTRDEKTGDFYREGGQTVQIGGK